ncbi:MAG TPA: DUF2079 domain-containing protein [Chthoniobacteraceae bacterium]
MLSALAKSPRPLRIGAVLFSLAVFLISAWHWWSFQYGTFDLAFYVQALWLMLRGQWNVSLLNVSLMGNHAEPIVFLFAPLFAICPHPLLLVGIQTLALASMAFTGFRIARRLGFEENAAVCLGLATLLTPATSSVGVFEFHPEALAGPLLLLLIEAKLAGRLGRFWLWFVAVLACKENMAVLLIAFCAVFALLERKRGRAWLWRWHFLPMLAALCWLLICVAVIAPWLNSGAVDYGGLYSHLGTSAGDIFRNFFVEPHRAFGAVWRALTEGNLVWAMLLPLLFLPFLRPHWLLIAAPLLLQHLLSWRFSEWSLGAHYPAPLIPLFWIAATEAAARLRRPQLAVAGIVTACILANFWVGPFPEFVRAFPELKSKFEEREWKAQMLASIPPEASVTANQPFLSHLAERENLHSLHHVLKGLKTLGTERYTPPATDVVFADYRDASTFNPVAGFYHPESLPGAERLVPSSDRLLHEFLRGASWKVESRNEATLFTRGAALRPPRELQVTPAMLDEQTRLLSLEVIQRAPGALELQMAWDFGADRRRFPWLMLVLSDGRRLYTVSKGPCAPEAGVGRYDERWLVVPASSLPSGHYALFALFYDELEAVWARKIPPNDLTFVSKRVELGHYHLQTTAPEVTQD